MAKTCTRSVKYQKLITEEDDDDDLKTLPKIKLSCWQECLIILRVVGTILLIMSFGTILLIMIAEMHSLGNNVMSDVKQSFVKNTDFNKVVVSKTPFQQKTVNWNVSEFYKVNDIVEKQTVDYILSNVNLSVDPCNNFYEFACQGWIQSHSDQSHHPDSWSETRNVFNDLENKTRASYTSILEEKVQTSDLRVIRQAKNHYKACLQRLNKASTYNSYDERLYRDIWLDLLEYGGWPILYKTWQGDSFNWTRVIYELAQSYAYSILFDITTYTSKLDITYVHITPPSTFFGKESTGLDESVIEDFVVDSVKNILSYFYKNETFDDINLQEKARNIVQVGKELSAFVNSSLSEDVKRTIELNYNHTEMRLDQILALVNETIGPYAMGQFKELMDGYFNLSKKFHYFPSENKIYSVSDISYFLQAINFTTTFPKDVMANYLLFVYVANKLVLDNSYSARSKIPKRITEWCTETVLNRFKYSLGHVYAKQKFQTIAEFQRISDQVMNLFRTILSALQDLFLKSSLKNRDELVSKLNDITLCTGFPNWVFDEASVENEYDGLVLNQTSFEEQEARYKKWYESKELEGISSDMDSCWYLYQPGDIGAKTYVPQLQIYLPPAMLQSPFFEIGRPMSANFGSLGTLIGYEITYALANLDWGWKRGSFFPLDDLTTKTQCLKDQYNKFWVADGAGGNQTLYVKHILPENFADSGGLAQAYKAYQNERINSFSNDKPRHFGSANYNDQMFFLAFAQNFCQSFGSSGIASFMRHWYITPGLFRVLGTLQNSKEFAKVWNCPSGSNMNPSEKCSMF